MDLTIQRQTGERVSAGARRPDTCTAQKKSRYMTPEALTRTLEGIYVLCTLVCARVCLY